MIVNPALSEALWKHYTPPAGYLQGTESFISIMSPSLKIHCPSVSRLKHKLHFDVIFVIILTNLLGPNH